MFEEMVGFLCWTDFVIFAIIHASGQLLNIQMKATPCLKNLGVQALMGAAEDRRSKVTLGNSWVRWQKALWLKQETVAFKLGWVGKAAL